MIKNNNRFVSKIFLTCKLILKNIINFLVLIMISGFSLVSYGSGSGADLDAPISHACPESLVGLNNQPKVQTLAPVNSEDFSVLTLNPRQQYVVEAIYFQFINQRIEGGIIDLVLHKNGNYLVRFNENLVEGLQIYPLNIYDSDYTRVNQDQPKKYANGSLLELSHYQTSLNVGTAFIGLDKSNGNLIALNKEYSSTSGVDLIKGLLNVSKADLEHLNSIFSIEGGISSVSFYADKSFSVPESINPGGISLQIETFSGKYFIIDLWASKSIFNDLIDLLKGENIDNIVTNLFQPEINIKFNYSGYTLGKFLVPIKDESTSLFGDSTSYRASLVTTVSSGSGFSWKVLMPSIKDGLLTNSSLSSVKNLGGYDLGIFQYLDLSMFSKLNENITPIPEFTGMSSLDKLDGNFTVFPAEQVSNLVTQGNSKSFNIVYSFESSYSFLVVSFKDVDLLLEGLKKINFDYRLFEGMSEEKVLEGFGLSFNTIEFAPLIHNSPLQQTNNLEVVQMAGLDGRLFYLSKLFTSSGALYHLNSISLNSRKIDDAGVFRDEDVTSIELRDEIKLELDKGRNVFLNVSADSNGKTVTLLIDGKKFSYILN